MPFGVRLCWWVFLVALSFFVDNVRTFDVGPFPGSERFGFGMASWLQEKNVVPNHKQIFESKITIWHRLAQVKFHIVSSVSFPVH